MKELSIEQKAQRYDEAIKKAEEFKNNPFAGYDGTDLISSLFPELAESEDEKIRKVLLNDFKNNCSEYYCEGVNRDMILAWLEKQGEHTNFLDKIQIGDKVTRNENGVLVNLSQLNRIAKPDENQGEQKLNSVLDIEILFGAKDSELQEASYHIPEGFHAEIEGNRVVIKKGEKPTAWSEEDEIGFNDALWVIQQARTIAKDENDMGNLWYAEDWLKSLKERVQPQPQQEWSYEDKRNFFVIEQALFRPNAYGTKKEKKDALDWLKSLRPQPHWKPSDEQMDALDGICSYIRNKANWEISQDMVSDLYKLSEQLKKLRGEKQ